MSNFSKKFLKKLAINFEKKMCINNEIINQENQPILYIIERGTVQLSIETNKRNSNQKLILEELNKGDYFG